MARTITHSSSGAYRKEACDQLLGLCRIRSDRARDEAEIDAGVLRLLEGLGMEQHAHGSGNMGVVRLGPVIVDPLLHHAERSARIDLRRLLCARRLNQHERGGNESCITHVMLLASVRRRGHGANVSGSSDAEHEAAIATILRKSALSLAFKMWRLPGPQLTLSQTFFCPARAIASQVDGRSPAGREQQTQHAPPARIGCSRWAGWLAATLAMMSIAMAAETAAARTHRRRGQSPRRCGNHPLLFSCRTRRTLRRRLRATPR